jgi:GNAT superfamily N-acetyltransferase
VTRDELLASCFPYGGVRTPDESLELGIGHAAVLCHVGLYWRTLRIGGRNVAVAGIGAVATDPAVRRHGFASFLIEAAHGFAVRRGYDLAALFCDEENYLSLYDRLGYTWQWRSDWPANLAICPLVGTANGGTDYLDAIDEPPDRW